MSKVEICPVCGGKGKLCEVIPGHTSTITWTTCHGCGGRGWVMIEKECVYLSN